MALRNVQLQRTIDAAGAAEILGVSAATVRRWARDGKISHIPLPSGRMRFLVDDIEALLEPVDTVTDQPLPGLGRLRG